MVVDVGLEVSGCRTARGLQPGAEVPDLLRGLRINAEIASQSKALDRKTTLDAARIKLDNTADPIMLKKVDGYNSWLEPAMSMGQAPTTEQMTAAQKTFGVSELFAPADPYAKVTIPAPK